MNITSYFYKLSHSFLLALLIVGGFPGFVCADEAVPKLVYLVVDGDKLIASNIKFNRFDELKLQAKETVENYAVGNAVIVVVTNKRIIAYSVYTASWRTRVVEADENFLEVFAEDYSALVQTTKRFLSFNGKNGVWTENQRSKIFD